MPIITNLAPYFERYLTLEGVHPTATYNYKARELFGLPVLVHTMHSQSATRIPGCIWQFQPMQI
jgi:hypothetical protein